MKKELGGIVLVLIFLFCLLPVKGEGAGASFLKIGMGARAASMGEAYTALADDGTAIYWNPAGLAQLERQELNFMHNEWFTDIKSEFIGLAYPVEGLTFAGALNFLYMGEIPVTEENSPHTTGRVFEASDLALCLALAQRLDDDLFMGAGFKIINQKIEKEKAAGYAVDLGLIYKPYPIVSFGLVAQNLGSSMKFVKEEFSLPMTYRAGLAVGNRRNFTFAADISKVKDAKLGFSSGLEVWFGKIMALRFGWRYRNSNTELGRFRGFPTGLTGGFGINMGNSTQIDYCFAPYGELEDTHRLSLAMKLGLRKEIRRTETDWPEQAPSWRPKPEVVKEKPMAGEEPGIKRQEEKKSALAVKVRMNGVTIWQGAGSNYPSMAKVNKGTELTVLDTSNKWYYKIMLPDGRVGWINSTFVEW